MFSLKQLCHCLTLPFPKPFLSPKEKRNKLSKYSLLQTLIIQIRGRLNILLTIQTLETDIQFSPFHIQITNPL